MSATMEGIDARGYLTDWLKGVTGMYVTDINAVPDDKWTATFGGCTRPANELTADAISLLLWCTEALNGRDVPTAEGELTKRLTAEINTKEKASAKITEVANDLAAALASASDETLNSVITAPWGMPTPLYMIAQIAVSHIWYHDGQLNYIHCMLGDGKVYWTGS